MHSLPWVVRATLLLASLVWPCTSASTLTMNPSSLDFGGQSMRTTSLPRSVSITNTGTAATTVSAVEVSPGFAVAHDCTTLGAGRACSANVTFTPLVEGSTSGTLVARTISGSASVSLAGTGEKGLVTHYYRSVLRRAPDAAGKSYWEAEAGRMQALGVGLNEVWFAMAMQFYSSAEYAAQNRNPTEFVRDLYVTFFNREADSAGLGYWTGQLARGMPREVVLAGFMFSAEFAEFTRAVSGNSTSRPEVDAVVDFFRGLLGRLPDSSGFGFWLAEFRRAQCQGATAVNGRADVISNAFIGSEYLARERTNAQFVGDLYNAFLRRGGDLEGVLYWIRQLDTGAMTRQAMRRHFMEAGEFNARIAAVVREGCLQTARIGVTTTGAGRVTSAPPGIDCGLTCSATFPLDTTVVLAATPEAGQQFLGWGDACAGTAPCTLTATGAQHARATFSVPTASASTIKVTINGRGRVTSRPAGLDCPETCSHAFPPGTTVGLTAVPAEGRVFKGWGGDCAGTGACLVTAKNTGPNVTADFYEVLLVTVSTGGRVTSTPPGIACPGTCRAEFPKDTVVSLKAVPDDAFRFHLWTGDCVGAAGDACTVTLNNPLQTTAQFGPAAPLVVTANALPRATVGQRYNPAVAAGEARGGVGPNSWSLGSLANGAPPIGIVMDVNGFFDGTPSGAPGIYRFLVCAQDRLATIACAEASITLDPAPVAPPPPPPEGSRTCTGTGTITVTGVLRDPAQPICRNALPLTSPITISLTMTGWHTPGTKDAATVIGNGLWICESNQPSGRTQIVVPRITLEAATADKYRGRGTATLTSGTISLDFEVAGASVSGTITRVFREADASWNYSGTFSCSL